MSGVGGDWGQGGAKAAVGGCSAGGGGAGGDIAAGRTTATCPVCPHHCRLAEGQLGACRARRNVGGSVAPEGYGRITSLAIDPVEKKPLARFMPGSAVLSVGGYGCNLHCPFCQNWQISQAGVGDVPWEEATPEGLVGLAARKRARNPRVVGLAFTYNEPLVCWEFVRDCARLARANDLVSVLVSNGCASAAVVDQLAPLLDAANIDLKGFTEGFYRACGGNLEAVKATIERLAAEPGCHLEVTTLVVPGMNDTDEEMDAIASWLARMSPGIVLHVTRFFPRWRMQDRPATPVPTVYHLAEVAREHLPFVYVGNC